MKKNRFLLGVLGMVSTLVFTLIIIGCDQPTSSSSSGGGTGGSTEPTPVIFTDFESDLGGWQGNNATVERTTDQKKNGDYSCKVTTGDAGWKTVWMYNIGNKILNDVAYNYSVWVYQNSGSNVKFSITIKTSSNQYKSVKYQATIPSGVWTEITATYTLATADGTASDIYIESDTNPVTFYFDDFKVIQAPAP